MGRVRSMYVWRAAGRLHAAAFDAISAISVGAEMSRYQTLKISAGILQRLSQKPACSRSVYSHAKMQSPIAGVRSCPRLRPRPYLKQLSQAIIDRQWSAREVVEASIARVEAVDRDLHAFCTLDDTAIEQAQEIDRRLAGGLPVGPLAGVPLP